MTSSYILLNSETFSRAYGALPGTATLLRSTSHRRGMERRRFPVMAGLGCTVLGSARAMGCCRRDGTGRPGAETPKLTAATDMKRWGRARDLAAITDGLSSLPGPRQTCLPSQTLCLTAD